MKIALLTELLHNHSGFGRIVSSLAVEYVREGHEVHVITSGGMTALSGVEIHMIAHVPISRAINRIAYRRSCRTLMKELGCDIVHTFGVGADANVVSAQSCHRAAVQIRKSGRGYTDDRWNFGVFDFVALGDERDLMTSENTKTVIAVSNLVRQQLIAWYGTSSERVVVVPNGVSLSRFGETNQHERATLRARFGLSTEHRILLFVGNEFARKGLGAVIEALGRLADERIRLLVVGGGEQSRYRKLARRLGVDGKVIFAGSISPVEPIYHVADAFVFPTRYEPFGMAVIEAMAARVPVITSFNCGAVEGLNHGKHALLLNDPQSSEELVENIRTLLEDRTLHMSIVDSAYQFVSRLEWSRIAGRLLDIYRTIRSDA